MLDTLKEKLAGATSAWLSEIEQKGACRIDISQEFERIFAHNLIHIAFGEDINDEKFDFDYLVDKQTGRYETRKVSIRQAMHNGADQVLYAYLCRFSNPLCVLEFLLCQTEKYKPGRLYDPMRQNCKTVRG